MRAGMKWGVVASAGAAAIVLGCNAILGIQDVRPEDAADAAASDAGGRDAAQDAPARDAGADAVATDSGPDCPGGGTRCNGTCTNTTSDARNCGACNHDCSALLHVTGVGATCNASACSVPASACAPGYAHCTANPDDGCETDITKAAQCGACGAACPAATPVCQANGTGGYGCVSGCSGATPTLCGTSCVNTTTDPNHCNTCTNACPSPPTGGNATCASSVCGVQCNGGYHQCGASATCARDDDATKCGPTCVFCAAPASNGSATCTSGACGIACNAGAHQCGTSAVCALDNDATRCGAACTACPVPANGSATCVSGQCGITCTGAFIACNGVCTSQTDPSNCGACGRVCNGVGLFCSPSGCSSWTGWPMPNPVAASGLPNPASYDASSVDVVVDNVTGLTWQRVLDAQTRTWADAKLYCAGLTLAGRNDWRVPSRIELVSLVDFTRASPGPTIDSVAFPNTPSEAFWSSLALAGNSSFAWSVDFGSGGTVGSIVSSTSRVRCVR